MTTTTAPNRCAHAGCRTTAPCRFETLEPITGATTITAAELVPGDLVVDETGARKFAAFDTAWDADRVRIFTAYSDRLNGWPEVLTLEAHDRLTVIRPS